MATDEQIKIAFNAGYTMQQHNPASVDKLLVTNEANEIVQAFSQGAKKMAKEKIIEQQKINKERSQTKTHKR
jgi:hypothetical protein